MSAHPACRRVQSAMERPVALPSWTGTARLIGLALGCAILAARGAGRFASIEEGAQAMVRTTRTIEPNAANAKRYQSFYPQYRELYAALKKVRETR